MAMADSVTVSMGEEMRGVFSVIFLVRADVKSWQIIIMKKNYPFKKTNKKKTSNTLDMIKICL